MLINSSNLIKWPLFKLNAIELAKRNIEKLIIIIYVHIKFKNLSGFPLEDGVFNVADYIKGKFMTNVETKNNRKTSPHFQNSKNEGNNHEISRLPEMNMAVDNIPKSTINKSRDVENNNLPLLFK